MSRVLEKGEIGTQTQKSRTPCEDAGRDQGGASPSQGMAVIAGRQPEADKKLIERGRGQSPSQENQPSCHCLELRLLASRTGRQCIFIVYTLQCAVLCYRGPRKQMRFQSKVFLLLISRNVGAGGELIILHVWSTRVLIAQDRA